MLVLASSSQTRANILENYGIEFVQREVDFDEDAICENSPKTFVYKATCGKMNRYLELYGNADEVLCADTVVTCEGKILRKAKDESEAREILTLQSSNEVSIITCMIYQRDDLKLVDISTTYYNFAPFVGVEEYLNSGEWRGKAGACMVEGFCKKFVKSVHGFESNAMGLCVEK